MKGKKQYYITQKPKKKVRVEHYCRVCGELYCVRLAPAFENEPSVLRFYGHCCAKCAQSLDDIAEAIKNINYIVGTEAGKFKIKTFEKKLMR